MKEGRYFRIPEGPADVERLWHEAKLLDSSSLPTWLSAEDLPLYRFVGSVSEANLPADETGRYLAERREIEAAGLILDQHPHNPGVSHVIIAAPTTQEIWSIGIYAGDSPFTLGPTPNVENPVLTRDHVLDVPAVFVADPFMIRVESAWYMFFEVMNWRANKGEIGLAISKDGMRWTYQHIVLAEPFHLSYPYVFEWMGSYYMIPESHQAGAVHLYKALEFPIHWSLLGTLLDAPYLVDASIVRHGNKWWLFAETNPEVKHDTLRLYYADELLGPWDEHPKSPIVQGTPQIARPGGRVLSVDDRVIRYAQNCYSFYGEDVRAFDVMELTTVSYQEREVDQSPVLRPSGAGWNAHGMHHIDAHFRQDREWIACVDGCWRVS